MNLSKRLVVWTCVFLLLLLAVAAFSFDWMLQQRTAAQYAAQDLSQCHVYAAQINELKNEPHVAAAQEIGIQELGARIEAASKAAALGQNALESVYPQAASRLGNTPYVVKPTALSLRGTTLSQLTAFLYHLSNDSGLTVRELRLRTPRGSENANVWDAEATLTYLIFSPPDSRRP